MWTMFWKHRRVVLIAAIVAATAIPGAHAQIPAPPQPTLWSWLGIPQGARKVHGALFNRRGNLPGLEKKLPIKALGDPANLAPDMPPAVQKAAELKIAEDLKPQKIKAVKFLTKIGCGCYDLDGGVTEALVAATQDCTEEVRLATVEAIYEAAGNGCCGNCGMVCCCKEDLVKRLAQMAYERDDSGCYLEPSERVREAALLALQKCCPSTGDPAMLEIVDEVEEIDQGQEVEEVPGDEVEQPSVLEVPDDSVFRVPPHARPVVRYVPQASPRARVVRHTTDQAPAQLASVRRAAHNHKQTLLTETSAVSRGAIVRVTPDKGRAHVHLSDRSVTLREGSALTVYRQVGNDVHTIGHVQVQRSVAGAAHVVPMRGTQMAALQQGDVVVQAVENTMRTAQK